jgi:hypothetical protein
MDFIAWDRSVAEIKGSDLLVLYISIRLFITDVLQPVVYVCDRAALIGGLTRGCVTMTV